MPFHVVGRSLPADMLLQNIYFHISTWAVNVATCDIQYCIECVVAIGTCIECVVAIGTCIECVVAIGTCSCSAAQRGTDYHTISSALVLCGVQLPQTTPGRQELNPRPPMSCVPGRCSTN